MPGRQEVPVILSPSLLKYQQAAESPRMASYLLRALRPCLQSTLKAGPSETPSASWHTGAIQCSESLNFRAPRVRGARWECQAPLSSLNHPCLEREQHRGSRKGQITQRSGTAKPRLRPGFLMPSPVGLSLCLQRSGMRVLEVGSLRHVRLPQRLYLGDLSVSAGTVFTGVTRFRLQ